MGFVKCKVNFVQQKIVTFSKMSCHMYLSLKMNRGLIIGPGSREKNLPSRKGRKGYSINYIFC